MKRIAHVGMTKSEEDRSRIISVFDWLSIYVPSLDLCSYKSEIIDLNTGRDFLTETDKYEIVLLHFIFNGKPHHSAHFPEVAELKVSPCSSWNSWRKRLEQCGAQYVFTFGNESEVSGRYLVDIPGYKPPILSSGSLAVFIKQ